MKLGLGIYIIGIVGFITKKSNILELILALELMLLGVTLLFLMSSMSIDDLEGELIGLYIIVLAGVESIIGITIIINYN